MEQGQSGQSAPARRVTAPSGQPDARPPSYPGTEASVGTVVSLADAYWDAAHRLLPQIEKGRGVSSERTRLAVEKGLSLRRRTAEHLIRLSDQRDYLVVRYGPEQLGDLSEINRMFATLKEIAEKVRAAIFEQPYDRADPRYKVYW